MSVTKEILTFQFGNYANYVGAHLWNIQEAGFSYDTDGQPSMLNHDVLYREGQNYNRQTTYTPRLLLVDLDGSLKHLPREGELYGNAIKRTANEKEDPVKKLKADLEWRENEVEVVAKPEQAKHDFQRDLDDPEVNVNEKDYNLEDTVDTWTDFLYSRFHPRTVNVINEFKYHPDKQTFDTFSCGAQLWQSEQFQDEFTDKIRQYVEECDYLQGFQTIFDCFNGYSGLATKCLQHLNDEYTKVNFAVPVYSPKNILSEMGDEPMTDSIRVANSALAFHQLIEQASMFLPLSTSDRVWRKLGSARKLRSLQYQADNLYQTSAILASYLDTLSIRYRLRDAPASYALAGFCGDLTNNGRRLAAGALSLPFPMQADEDLIDCLDKFEGPLFTQLTPNCKIGTDYVIQSLCVRGIPLDRLKRPAENSQLQRHMAAYKCASVSEMLQLYLQCANHMSMAHVCAIPTPMTTRLPYPCNMFERAINTSGFGTPFGSGRSDAEHVQSAPTLATAQSSQDLSETLETLHREAKRIKIAKIHRFKSAGLEDDDYAEALESLLLFKDNYEDDFLNL